MEQMILILLLALMSKDGQMKDSLQSALAFYRENRELITRLAGANAPKEYSKQDKETEQEKSRPQAVGNDKILEEFLKSNLS